MDYCYSQGLGIKVRLKWSETEDILYVLESDSTPELVALDGSTFSHTLNTAAAQINRFSHN